MQPKCYQYSLFFQLYKFKIRCNLIVKNIINMFMETSVWYIQQSTKFTTANIIHQIMLKWVGRLFIEFIHLAQCILIPDTVLLSSILFLHKLVTNLKNNCLLQSSKKMFFSFVIFWRERTKCNPSQSEEFETNNV